MVKGLRGGGEGKEEEAGGRVEGKERRGRGRGRVKCMFMW